MAGLWLAVVLWAVPALAGGRPEGVVVVVNEESWASQTVANEFIHLRRIPPGNVIYLRLNDLRDFETVDVDTFRVRILTPVLDAIRRRGLDDHVDCVAYSCDIPYAVAVGKDVGSLKLPQITTTTAALNGLTYLHKLVLAKDPGKYLALNANWYYRRALRKNAPEDLWSPADRQRATQAMSLVQGKKYAEAEAALTELLKAHPQAAWLHYNLACCLAQQDKPEEAMASLQRAAQTGWGNREHAEKDEDLKPLRAHKDFKKVLEIMKPPQADDVMAPRGFRSGYTWTPDGNTGPGGVEYLLSTMLAVTSGRGNSVREAVECLRRSAAADGTRPDGTVYFMVNDDVRSRTRQYGFDAAVARLKVLGVAAESVRGNLPEKKTAAGVMAGSAGFNWSASGSTIRPGAICEHLTSTGGVMTQHGGQTCISEWIRHGATGTSGTVTEPFAIQAKFPTPFIHCFYASGCTLAEAFYQSVNGPYQLLIVGDPLCRPWARIPKVRIAYEPGVEATGRNEPAAPATGKNTPAAPATGKNTPAAPATGKNEPGAEATGRNEPAAPATGKNAPGAEATVRNEPGAEATGKNEPGAEATGKNEPGAEATGKNEPGAPATRATTPPDARTVKGTVSLRPSVESPEGFRPARFDLFVDGRLVTMCPPGKTLDLDTTKLSDGYHGVSVSVTGADPIETQGAAELEIVVSNAGMKPPEMTGGPDDAQGRVKLGEVVSFDLSAPGAKGISVRQNSREVAAVQGEKGTVKVDFGRLGLGPTRLQAVAEYEGGQRVAAWPREFTVVPPDPLPAVALSGGASRPGLKVTTPGRGAVAIKELRQLADAGVRKGEPFVLEGFFDVAAEDVYQFQVWAEGTIALSVDGKALLEPRRAGASPPASSQGKGVSGGKGWKFVPVALAKGTHLLRVEGRLDNMGVDIRFGGPGGYTISDSRFRCTGEAAVLPAPSTKPASKPATAPATQPGR